MRRNYAIPDEKKGCLRSFSKVPKKNFSFIFKDLVPFSHSCCFSLGNLCYIAVSTTFTRYIAQAWVFASLEHIENHISSVDVVQKSFIRIETNKYSGSSLIKMLWNGSKYLCTCNQFAQLSAYFVFFFIFIICQVK